MEPGDPQKMVAEIEGVRLFARGEGDRRLHKLTAGDYDPAKIRRIADQLQRRGYGVTRSHIINATRKEYTLQAEWAGPGEPTAVMLPR